MSRINVATEVAGAVWKITTQVGQQLASGDAVLILESMKMEIPVVTEAAGVIGAILVKEGDAVQEGQVVAVIDG
jgi:acetyl-CoA carboxylase biotin carboxyl carrier protein